METHLLRTKLYVPRLHPNRVARPRLLERLEAGLALDHDLFLLSAPAGYGKTTLLSAWLAARDAPPAWVSLDEGDNAPSRFLSYLIAALDAVRPAADLGDGVRGVLRAPQPPDVPGVMALLVDRLTAPDVVTGSAGPGAGTILVLDDYHVITHPAVHRAVGFLLEHRPPDLHLVIATRADPPLPVARLRGRGRLTELRQADLRFTPGEVAAFFAQALDRVPAEDDLAALAARTEGWAAGLQMAAASLRGREDAAALIAAFTGGHAYIADYLAGEVLDRQSAADRDFLLRTSVLDRFTAPLCAAVTGMARAGEVLARLHEDNLFIVPLDDERRWYRYHHLFGDLLRRRLLVADPDLVPELHRRAAGWYEARAERLAHPIERAEALSRALAHRLEAGETDRAVALADAHLPLLWRAGASDVVSRLLARLPDQRLGAYPRLALHRALEAFLAGQVERVERYLDLAEAQLTIEAASAGSQAAPAGSQAAPALAERPVYLGMASALRANLAFVRGATADVRRLARRALDFLPEDYAGSGEAPAALSEQAVTWRGSAAIALGDGLTAEGDLPGAVAAYAEALRVSRRADNFLLALIAGLKLAETYRGLGALRRAAQLCEDHVAWAAAHHLSAAGRVGGLLAIQGDVLRAWNRLDEAEDHLARAAARAQGRDLGREPSAENLLIRAWVLTFRVKLDFARRDWTALEAAVAVVRDMGYTADLPVWIESRITAWQARMYVARGRDEPAYLDAAASLLAERGVSAGDEPPYLREGAYLALARLLLARERWDAAGALLDRLARAAEAGERQGRVVEVMVLRALALDARGSRGPALDLLARAVIRARPEGYVRLFVDEGEPLAQLLYAAVDRDVVAAEAGRLLAAFPVPASGDGLRKTAPELVEPLTDRELEVLALIDTGATNQEIAQELVISVYTVKKHVSNLLGKLEVDNRREAARRARAIGLLPSLPR